MKVAHYSHFMSGNVQKNEELSTNRKTHPGGSSLEQIV